MLYQHCPRCRLAIRCRASYLALEHCPRCLGRAGILTAMFTSPLNALELRAAERDGEPAISVQAAREPLPTRRAAAPSRVAAPRSERGTPCSSRAHGSMARAERAGRPTAGPARCLLVVELHDADGVVALGRS